MRICKDTKSGLMAGLFMGYAISSNWTLNSTDAELLTGGSLQCLTAMAISTIIGGLMGFANSMRRNPRENVPDNTDKAIISAFLLGLGYLWTTLPALSEIGADLTERWHNDFKMQPGPELPGLKP